MFKFDLIDNEKLVAMYRQTEISLVKPVIWVFLLIYLPWFFLIKYELYSQYSFWLFIWTCLVLLFAVYTYVLWLVNVYVVTSRRLISFQYQSLFSKSVIETPLENILNVSFKTTGVFSSLMDFGDVEVKVTGLSESMVLKNVREPAKLKDFLWKFHRESILPKTIIK